MKHICYFLLTLLFFCPTPAAGITPIKLLADDGEADEYFGGDVDISGDRIIVGASSDDDNCSNGGSAYIFQWDGAAWIQQAELWPDDCETYGYFGANISIDGDYVVGGSPFHITHDTAYNSGAAFIFHWDGTAWIQQAMLTPPEDFYDGNFGITVTMDGDYALIGAYRGEDYGQGYLGAVFIFHRDGTSWNYEAKLLLDSDTTSSNGSNVSVSKNDDYVVVGVSTDDASGNNSGAAYVFFKEGSDWTRQAKLSLDDWAEDDAFGSSVSINGDYLVVGAYGDDDIGSAYIFHRDGSEWTLQAKLTPEDGAADDRFARSVSMDGDYVVVGAHKNDDKGTDVGSVYVFQRDGTTWPLLTKLTPDYGDAEDYFGISVSLEGETLVVGASRDDDNGSNAGAAYIYDLSLVGCYTVNEVTAQYFTGYDDAVQSCKDDPNACGYTAGYDVGLMACSRPDTPTLLSPAGDTQSPVTYIWYAVPDATWYRLWMEDQSGIRIRKWYEAGDCGCGDDETFCFLTPEDDEVTEDTDCTWWVRAWNTHGHSDWSDGMDFTLLPASSGKSASQKKTARAATARAVDGCYTEDEMTASYDDGYDAGIQYCTDHPETCGIDTTDYTEGYEAGYESGFADCGPPVAATLISPDTTAANPVTYTWNSVKNATEYYLWVMDSSGNKVRTWYTPEDCGCEDGESTCSLTPDDTCDLLLPGTAKWWVRTQNDQGLGSWSDTMKFTVTEDECNGDSSD